MACIRLPCLGYGKACVGRRAKSIPIYDFKCPQCGHAVERLIKHSEIPAQKCPKCGTTLERQHTLDAKGYSFRFNYMES